MALEEFLLPGEQVRCVSAGEVYYGRSPHTLYVTGERLLLYGDAGRLARKESVFAERLADLDSLEYTEDGLFSRRSRLKVNFHHDRLSITGRPETVRGIWQTLQQYACRTPVGHVDDEATLVAPPPAPLFDDQASEPTQVQPLPLPLPPPPTARRRPPSASRLVPALAGVCVVVILVAAVLALRQWRPSEAPANDTQASAGAQNAAPPPTPAPTPVSVHVVDEVFTLEPGSHRAVKFTIPGDYPSARVSGGFRVTGGSYVDFYLMDERQYNRFAFGDEPEVTSVVYRGKQWNARVGERLPPGDYYLVFDNWDSSAGAQTVAAEFFAVFG